jgi:hypothetical protein
VSIKTSLETKLAAFDNKFEQFCELKISSNSDQQDCLNSVKKVFDEVRNALAIRESEMIGKIHSFFSISAESPDELLAAFERHRAHARQVLSAVETPTDQKKEIIQVYFCLVNFFFFKYYSPLFCISI